MSLHRDQKILVFGKSGQVAQALSTLSIGARAIFLSKDEVNFESPSQIQNVLDQHSPTHIINCSAYTAVDQAEVEQDKARLLNATAPGVIAQWCAAHQAQLIHYSTDYVFDGAGEQFWKETDRPNPLNWYGQTKYEGELAIQNSGCAHIILRISWVYSYVGTNFVKTMLRLGSQKEELSVINDQVGYPTSALDVARATEKILEVNSQRQSPFRGIYHLSGEPKTTWFEFASEIFRQAREMGYPLTVKNIRPIQTSEYPTRARRPLNSRLDSHKIHSDFGIELPDWKVSLHNCLRKIHQLT
ncbi:MAG: NAD(P)-dependent oxidoreductase [Oligoflexia bacterium]|nr:MAG: NAD(P)-dependent oxidoreductase [Oligoflexia bacterium]